MKIRNGFVSNSSSSSFLVLFPKKVETYDELFNLMWTDESIKNIQRGWIFKKTKSEKLKNAYNTVNLTFEEFQKWATEYVLREIKRQGENNYLRALSLLSNSSGWYDDDEKTFNIDDKQITSLNQFDKYIKKYDDLDNRINNFDWNTYSEDYYDVLQKCSDDLMWLYEIRKTLKEIKDALNDNKNTLFYSFSFSDEDGVYFVIMHSGYVFGNLKVYVESFH